MNRVTKGFIVISFSALQAGTLSANSIEVIESTQPTKFCFPQTDIRGGYDNLVIDHNLMIPESDHHKAADVYVAARLKSDPDTLWLLSGITWNKIESNSDIHNAQYQRYESLPIVVPIQFFHSPFDASDLAHNSELWVGYGITGTDTSPPSIETFNEMILNERFEQVWDSSPMTLLPANGLVQPYATICVETSTVEHITQTVDIDPTIEVE